MNSQQAPAITWGGQDVRLQDGDFTHLMKSIPSFDRTPFALGGAANRYYDLIVRQPIGDDEKPIPVAVVSKKYRLIQHRDMVERIVQGMERLKLRPHMASTDLCLSEYGARMRLRVIIPDYSLDPGDGHGVSMRLVCYNSVDGSGSLEVYTDWFRLVCSNGMAWEDDERYRRIHHENYLTLDSVAAHLEKSLARLPEQEADLQKLLGHTVSDKELTRWVDGEVTKCWGLHKAARVLHICRTGYDAKVDVQPGARNQRASTYEMLCGQQVPGAPDKANNAYQVCQALTWLVRNNSSIGSEWQMTKDVSRLMAKLAAG